MATGQRDPSRLKLVDENGPKYVPKRRTRDALSIGSIQIKAATVECTRISFNASTGYIIELQLKIQYYRPSLRAKSNSTLDSYRYLCVIFSSILLVVKKPIIWLDLSSIRCRWRRVVALRSRGVARHRNKRERNENITFLFPSNERVI